MSYLNNMYAAECPPLMSDGRSSVITDNLPKNDRFFINKGTSTNSFQFRDMLQKSGFSDLNN